jgi:carbon storage regulator
MMLILSRHKDESVVINHNIVVTIVDIRGNKVRLGISAPPEITVHREEIEAAINGHSLPAPQVAPTPAAVSRWSRRKKAGDHTAAHGSPRRLPRRASPAWARRTISRHWSGGRRSSLSPGAGS